VRSVRKLLVAGGLVIVTGPLCFTAAAQPDYVDLEAEAAAREAAGGSATADPYAKQPARSYPATSFGVDSAPAAPVTGTSAPAPTGQDSAGLGNLFLQIQRLQEEVMRLNGKVEEQAHELRVLKEQSLQRYMDLDERLSSGAAAAAAGGAASSGGAPVPAATAAAGGTAAGAAGSTQGGGAEQPGERSAYDAAYALVAGRRFDEAVPAFQQFLRDYPGGRYAANAHYWLGELYLVIEPPDLEASRQSFALLISEYPENPKTPDALYKLGKVQFMKGNREKAREYLDLVISQYSSTNSAVVKLARDFIAENY